jgi:hypothetical protein
MPGGAAKLPDFCHKSFTNAALPINAPLLPN